MTGEPADDQQGFLLPPRAYLFTVLVLVTLLVFAGFAPRLFGIGQTLTVMEVLTAPIQVLGSSRGLQIAVFIAVILVIGGSFRLIERSGVMGALVERLASRFRDQPRRLLVISASLFAIAGSFFGMIEEIIPLVLYFVPLALRLGWGRLVGVALPFASAGVGFAAATTNPFTLLVAQVEAGLPPFSGLGLRILFLVCALGLLILFLLRAVSKATPCDSEIGEKPAADSIKNLRAVLGVLAGCLVAVFLFAIAVIFIPSWQGLAFPVIGVVMLGGAILVAVIQQLSARSMLKSFARGVADFSPAVVLILLATSIPWVVEQGELMNPLLSGVSGAIDSAGWHPVVTALSMYGLQIFINLLIPGGSSQALLTIPFMAQLGDLLEISRQTVVFVFHCGDGFSNLLWPTNPVLIIALGMGGVRYFEWFRFILPLQLVLLVASSLFIVLAVVLGY